MGSQKVEKYLHDKSISLNDTNIAEQFQKLESFYINKFVFIHLTIFKILGFGINYPNLPSNWLMTVILFQQLI